MKLDSVTNKIVVLNVGSQMNRIEKHQFYSLNLASITISLVLICGLYGVKCNDQQEKQQHSHKFHVKKTKQNKTRVECVKKCPKKVKEIDKSLSMFRCPN